jgi:putative radical SAM enzyme (TIGR03279 family)
MKIRQIEPVSIAAELGISGGDELVSINGRPIADTLDYRFQSAGEEMEVLIRKPGGEEILFEIEKGYDENLGILPEEDKIITCKNNCNFCFVRQNPRRMRRTLYVKDDDYRLSFLHGQFVTMTNLKQSDIDRIIEYHLSPLYVSVHTTHEALRREFLENPKAPDLMPLMEQFFSHGIVQHTQVVLAPGVNDGPELEKTIADLARYYPMVPTLAIVPVGLTRFRSHLRPMRPVDAEYASGMIDCIEKRQKVFRAQWGVNFLYAADEWYLLAGRDIPPAEYYDGFPQLENGIGMIRQMTDDTEARLKLLPRTGPPKKYLIVTGKSAFPHLKKCAEKIMQAASNLKIEVAGLENRFFGPGVTVSGLLIGEDILAGVAEVGRDFNAILLPPNCVNFSGIMLDEMTPGELADILGVPVLLGQPALIDTFLHLENPLPKKKPKPEFNFSA